jgi:DNA-binding CsgD family transcriptional regulator/N-acetylneuraminic acid mutarotase
MSNGQTSLQLSTRELQVLELVVTGASNQEIARKLVISVNTVKVHLRNIFEKLGVQSRTEATLKAIQEGLVRVENDSEGGDIAPVSKTFLLTNSWPLELPRWQQIYLTIALLVTIVFASIPFLFNTNQAVTSEVLPPIYKETISTASESHSSVWTPHAPMPTKRAGLALVAYQGQIFAIGGMRGNNQATRSVEIFDPFINTWKEGANKLVATANIAGVVIGDKIYIPGGCANNAQAVDSFGIYNPKTDTWIEGPTMPSPRCGYGLATFEDKLYLFGGWNGAEFEDTIFVYSPQTEQWQVLKQKLPQRTGFMGAATLNDEIYITGGYDGDHELDQTYAFNPVIGQWTEKAPMREKRGGLGLISANNQLFAIGGGWEHPLGSSEKYNPTTNTWESFDTPFNSRWRNLGLAVVDNKIYAVGGWDGAEEKYVDAVVSYQYLYQIFIPISTFGN